MSLGKENSCRIVHLLRKSVNCQGNKLYVLKISFGYYQENSLN